jgi:hypothetical protein
VWEERTLERECPDGKKESSSKRPDKATSPKPAVAKSEAHAVISDDDHDSSAFMVHTSESCPDDVWYMDGGATEHMIDRLDWFVSIKEIEEGRWPVMIADNRRPWARGVGNINVQCCINKKWEKKILQRVLYVPELRKNLFSVGQAADKGFVTTYTCNACYLTNPSGGGGPVLIGTRANKLYKLELQVDVPVSQANLVATCSPSKPAHATATPVASKAKKLDLWHQRFGHVHPAMLIHMHNHNTVEGLELTGHGLSPSPCEGCALGKTHASRFPNAANQFVQRKLVSFSTLMYAGL